MKPLYIDYSGADAPKWVPFARKKMKQYAEQLEAVGLPFGRKYLKFDNVSISFYMSPLFAKLRIETGAPATFFGLYQIVKPGLIVYQYLVAFDDAGDEQWRLAFDSYDANTGFSRTLLGCSASGEKVLLLERDASTFIRVKEVTNGSITSAAEYDIGTAGYTDTFVSITPRVSVDGSRAIFSGPILDGFGFERVAFYYDKNLDPQIQAVETTFEWSTNHSFTILGSSDLSTAYLAFHRYRVTDAGTAPAIHITKLTRTEGDDETPPELLTEELEVETISGASHYVVVNEITSAPDGEIAVGYTTITPPALTGPRDLVSYVNAGGMDVEVGSLSASTITIESLEGGPRVFSLTPAAASFAYEIYTAFGVLSNGYVLDGTAALVTEDILAVDSGGSLVLADGSKYIVRRTEGDFDLVDDPYSGGAVLHTIAGNGDVYAEFNPLIQPTLERLVRKWVPETDPDTGDVTGYPTMQEIGDTPLSITATPVDPEVEETATLSGKILNVYVQRVVQS